MPSHPRSRPSGGPARYRGRDQPGRRAVLRRGSRARGTLLQDGRGRAADGTPVCAQTASTSARPNGARPSPRDDVGGPNATAGRARSTRAEPAPRAHRRRPALRAPSPRGRHVPSPPRAIGARLERLQDGAPVSGGLTRRELGVLRLVADGLSTPQIATRLGIGPSTARNHVTRILRSWASSPSALARSFGGTRRAASTRQAADPATSHEGESLRRTSLPSVARAT